MNSYRCVVMVGHRGAGHSEERVVLVRARDVIHALKRAKHLPGVKKGHRFRSGASVLAVERLFENQERLFEHQERLFENPQEFLHPANH